MLQTASIDQSTNKVKFSSPRPVISTRRQTKARQTESSIPSSAPHSSGRDLSGPAPHTAHDGWRVHDVAGRGRRARARAMPSARCPRRRCVTRRSQSSVRVAPPKTYTLAPSARGVRRRSTADLPSSSDAPSSSSRRCRTSRRRPISHLVSPHLVPNRAPQQPRRRRARDSRRASDSSPRSRRRRRRASRRSRRRRFIRPRPRRFAAPERRRRRRRRARPRPRPPTRSSPRRERRRRRSRSSGRARSSARR